MQKQKMISVILAIFTFASSVRAQTNDWSKVEFLDPGRFIRVKTDHVFSCSYEGETDDRLICERRGVTINVPRAEIREIRMLPAPEAAKDAKIGAGIGAGAGVIIGVSEGGPNRGVRGFFGGLAGAGFGALVGVMAGGTTAGLDLAIRHGKVIYKR
jgi:hypothetical protein